MAVTASGVQSAALVALTIIATVALTLWLVATGTIPLERPTSGARHIQALQVACLESGGMYLIEDAGPGIDGVFCRHPRFGI